MVILKLNKITNFNKELKVVRLITQFKTKKQIDKAMNKIDQLKKTGYIEIPGSVNMAYPTYAISFLKTK